MDKSRKEHHLKVVEDRPLREWILRISVAIILAAGITGSYYYGLFRGGKAAIVTTSETVRLEKELAVLQETEADLHQKLVNLRLGAEIDRQASEEVRQEVIELKNQLAQLQKENRFYRNLMAPAADKEGLNIGAVEIVETDVLRQYRYKVVLRQLATRHNVLNGTLTFNIVGRQDGAVKVLPLDDLSEEVDSVNIKLRFRYFQIVEGQLQLPPGFKPERIELVARSSGNNSATVKKRYGWLVQET